jgi:hypothetical protein
MGIFTISFECCNESKDINAIIEPKHNDEEKILITHTSLV